MEDKILPYQIFRGIIKLVQLHNMVLNKPMEHKGAEKDDREKEREDTIDKYR